jgi:hypothetical protein
MGNERRKAQIDAAKHVRDEVARGKQQEHATLGGRHRRAADSGQTKGGTIKENARTGHKDPETKTPSPEVTALKNEK